MQYDLPVKIIDTSLSTDLSYSGWTSFKMVETNPIGFGAVLVPNALGDLIPYTYGMTFQFGTVPYVALEAGTGAGILCMEWGNGFVRNDAWSWTPGQVVYIDQSTPGLFSQTSGVDSVPLGVAEDSNIIAFRKTFNLGALEYIEITHTGSSFEAYLEVDGSPEIEWIFSDETTDDTVHPDKDFGTSEERVTRLRVVPWTAVTAFNVGFTDEDSSWTESFDLLAQQNVTAISGLSYLADSLQLFSAVRNPILSLDFSGFSELLDIELYHSDLDTIDVSLCASLQRLCIEETGIEGVIDISGCPVLEDYRSAGNNISSIVFGTPPVAADTIWHICSWGNEELDPMPSPDNFPHLRHWFLNNSNQSGPLVFDSDSLEYIWCQYNNHSGLLDLSCGVNGDVTADNNAFTSVDISNCSGLTSLRLEYNSLNQTAVDLVLTTFNSFGTSGTGVIDLRNNSIPSATGLAAAASLISRGWDVRVDS